MNVAAPHEIFTRGVDVHILLLLAAGGQQLSGREIARRIDASEAGAREALNRLVRSGVVDRTPLGGTYAHSLNLQHVAVPVVYTMRGMRGAVIQDAREIVMAWEIAPVHAAIFGSFARGDGNSESDLDLLVVHAAAVGDDPERFAQWEAQLADLDELRLRTGNPVQVLDIPETTLQDPSADELATLHQIAEHEIELVGPRLTRLMRGVPR